MPKEQDNPPAGQTADFYLGRGTDAVYLGTLRAENVDPDALEAVGRFAAAYPDVRPMGPDSYRAAVTELLVNMPWGVGTTTWPHEYDRSDRTDWTYMFDTGSVFIYDTGILFAVIYCNGSRKPAEFPRVTRTERDHP